MRKKNLGIIKILTLILGIIVVLCIFGSEIKIVNGEDETFGFRGETEFPPQEGSCFWGGRLVNGMFYFYIYKDGNWQFSNDVRGTGMCPIKIWPEVAQKTFSDVWFSGYIGKPEHKIENIQEDFITREQLCRCYNDILMDREIKSVVSEAMDIGEIFGLEKGYLIGDGVEYYNISHYGESYDIFSKPEKKEKGIGITFVEKDSFLNIGEDEFTNIEPQKSPKHPPYIFLDEDGKIIRADFTVNSNGGEYTFKGETLPAPPNSRIFFDERTLAFPSIPSGIDIQVPDGIDLTEFSNLFNIFAGSENLLTIRGNDIKLNGLVLKNNDEEDGELIIDKEGYFLTKGIIEHNGRRFDASKQVGDLLFADSNVDLSDYNGNKVVETKNGFEIHSIEGKSVMMKVLPGNELFDTDENNYLQLEVSRGDSLEVIQGKVPVVEHHSSERGKTWIRNGKYPVKLSSSMGEYYPIEPEPSPYASLLESSEAVDFIVKSPTLFGDYDLVFEGNAFKYRSRLGEKEILSLIYTPQN